MLRTEARRQLQRKQRLQLQQLQKLQQPGMSGSTMPQHTTLKQGERRGMAAYIIQRQLKLS